MLVPQRRRAQGHWGLGFARLRSLAAVSLRVTVPFTFAALHAAAAAAQEAPAAAEANAASETAAKKQPPNALPGSPRPPGFGLAPEAPERPPAIGGRAPSFGAPTPKSDATFTIGGRIEGSQSIGIGEKPSVAGPTTLDHPLHTPPYVTGRQPLSPALKGSLQLQYGTPTLMANVAYSASSSGKEQRGFYEPSSGGTNVGQAYLTVTPQPMGKLQLRFRVGAFTEFFGGPGQWGWGIYGPLIATRGFGESSFATYDATDSLRLSFEHGITGVPAVPEGFVRQGRYTGWTETGVSTLVQHAHAGFSYQNRFAVKLHWAGAQGTDERTYLYPGAEGQQQYETSPDGPQNGRLDVFVLETKWFEYPYGELGVSAGLWNFDKAHSVHDGLWWGLDWTKGAQDMMRTFMGNHGEGTGKVAAISSQYDMSLAQLLWSPRPFDGNAPDVRVALAGIYHWTMETDDPRYDGANGFMLGTETTYQMLSWFGTTLRAYGQSRDSDSSLVQVGDSPVVYQENEGVRRMQIYSISPGLAFRSNWQSQDRIELVYTRRFYNSAVDVNPARPFDRNVVSISAYIGF